MFTIDSKKPFIILAVISGICLACNQAPARLEEQSGETAVSTERSTVTADVNAGATPANDIDLQATPTVPLFVTSIQSRCIGAADSQSLGVEGDGRILFTEESRAGLWSTENFFEDRQLVMLDWDASWRISPDQTMMVRAIPESDPSKFEVLDLNTGELNVYSWPADRSEFLYDELFWSVGNLLYNVDQGGDFVFVSPETGLRLDMFSGPELAEGVDWYLDPTLNRLVYQDPNGEPQYIMQDLASGEIIASMGTKHFARFELDLPSWSPKGSFFAFQGNNRIGDLQTKLYIYDRDGEGGKVIDLSSTYSTFIIRPIFWSPDERFIAMWTQVSMDEMETAASELRLLIYDVHNRDLTDHCVRIGLANSEGVDLSLIWSPSSRYLIYNGDPLGERNSMLEADSGAILGLPEGVTVVAWVH